MVARDELLARIVAWAEADANVRALVQTGSGARADGSVDEFSDLDLEVVAADPGALAADDAWFEAFARMLVHLPLENERGEGSRLVFYEGGAKVDFTLCACDRLTSLRAGLDGLYERGYAVLVDKDGLAAALPAPSGRPPLRRPPNQAELDSVVREFWFEADHIPRYLARDEPWVVKHRDWTMKTMLLRMLEWHAVATAAGEPPDIWHIGTKLRRWVDARAWHDLGETFGRFDRASSRRALHATMRLFTRLTAETAAALGLEPRRDLAARVTAYALGLDERAAPPPPVTAAEHWEREAPNWASWTRGSEPDAYVDYSPGFFAFAPAAGRRTLEVGCGDGRVARDLAARGHRVTGVDIAPAMVRLAAEADPVGEYRVADAAALPFADESFDVVVAYNSLMDVDDLEGAVREAARVLVPGGCLAACITHPFQDAGAFMAREADAPFVVDGAYLETRRLREAFVRGGVTLTFAGWCHPLERYSRALEAAGFAIEAVREPAAADAAVERDPAERRWQRMPMFLFLRTVKARLP
jgi:aminoglycoside 6-adenylyltransferase